MDLADLGPAERFAAGALGEPGHRRFYLEVVAGGIRHSFPAEKEQVAALSSQGLRILAARDVSVDQDAVRHILAAGLDISEPEQEIFPIGTISLGLTADGMVVLTLTDPDRTEGVTFVVAPEQFAAMALRALEVVAAGRPVCQWCRLPMNDPDRHDCPAWN